MSARVILIDPGVSCTAASKVSTPKCNSYPSLTARKATVNTSK
jgi:hypothetical protein